MPPRPPDSPSPGPDRLKGIRDWPTQERPRERLLTEGPAALSDAQLLAILLQSGRQDASAVEVGMELLSKIGGLQKLGQMGVDELCQVPGIGPAKAAQLKAAVEVGKRALASPLTSGTGITSSADVYAAYYPLLRDVRQEVFILVLLDAKHMVIKDVRVSAGTLTASLVHPREVFSPAIRESAAAIICIHNHPSGDPTPSPEDRQLTQRLEEAGRLLGIPVLDHIVIGDGRYVSFADQGWCGTK
ncbi:MAG: DNA repair protein RadC [Nitrospiraceae bacterium]